MHICIRIQGERWTYNGDKICEGQLGERGEINESWRNGKGMEIGLGRKAKSATWDKSGDERECDNDDGLAKETKGDTRKRNRTLNE